MFNHLIKHFENVGVITITQDFIDHRNKEKNKFYAKGRTEEGQLIDADALLPEFLLLQSGIVERPDNWRHDFKYEGNKIDVKRITSKFFNIPSEEKLKTYVESYMMGELTHFCFYRDLVKYDRPLEVGDTQQIEIIYFNDIRSTFSNKGLSEDGGYYILVN